MKTTINFDPNVVQGHQEFPPETIEAGNGNWWQPCNHERKLLIGPEHTFHWLHWRTSCSLIGKYDYKAVESYAIWRELLVSWRHKEMKSCLACQRAKDHKQSVCVCEHTWLLLFETSSNIKDSCLSAGVSSPFKCKLKTCWVHPCKYWVGTP